ncbi:malonate decarboxylase holo-[acyl-carrier-protein] synthase [Massilia sp. DWR3-1-1]|uniref:malonate decarboxylase holo-[acyl-carrier-protein] synthase n=1 Tax=Massilia sp. DWR3-1-1 TaxID=2804559 RepID=UPI003CF28AF3
MFSRHELLYLTADGWARALAAPGADSALLGPWRENDWPLVVRRREPGSGADTVSLGLPAPPAADGARRRFACTVPVAAVARRQAPLALAAIVASAPAHWQGALAAVLADGGHDGAPPLQVFGSCAMQALTGQSYVGPASDIDLLLELTTLAQLDAGLALMGRHSAALPLDGELVFPAGDAVSWKEWASGADQRVLVKSVDAVRLLPKAQLRARLQAP